MPGLKGPLHRCSFYGNKAGRAASETRCWKWAASKPWPDALEAFTRTREMSGKPMLEYFAPLQKWLEEQNKARPVGGRLEAYPDRRPGEGRTSVGDERSIS